MSAVLFRVFGEYAQYHFVVLATAQNFNPRTQGIRMMQICSKIFTILRILQISDSYSVMIFLQQLAVPFKPFIATRYNYNVKTSQNFKTCRQLCFAASFSVKFRRKFALHPLCVHCQMEIFSVIGLITVLTYVSKK
jgi:hypothetical protein